MFKCSRCNEDFRDGVQCSVCAKTFDFRCSGITEAGYRKLGDRKLTWRCIGCKSDATSPLPVPEARQSPSPVPADLDAVMSELKRLTAQTASLPDIIAEIRSIKADLASLSSIKSELVDLRSSVDFIHQSYDSIINRVTSVEKEVQNLITSNASLKTLQKKVETIENAIHDFDQRSRSNNIEIKGVPASPSENLFSLISKIGDLIKCPITKDHINYVARVPTNNDKKPKNIIVSLHNRYLKEDFVAASKKLVITPQKIELQGDDRIFVNDHLTPANKLLLNKAKSIAKERGYAFIWVKNSKFFLRKTPTSPIVSIRSESDLSNLNK